MQDYYLSHITSKLKDEDLKLLEILDSNSAHASFKSMKNQQLQSLSQLSEAMYRKSVSRLISILFVENVTGSKEHSLYITAYGQFALNKTKAIVG